MLATSQLLEDQRSEGRVRRNPSLRRWFRFHLVNMSIVGTVPALTLLALGRVSRLDLALFAGFYAATVVSFGLAWHRMLAHRAFDAHPAVKWLLMAFAGMTFQGTPSAFIWNHRAHHAHADRPGDPHSPRHGFFHAHAGWFTHYQPPPAYKNRYSADPLVRFFDRTHIHWALLGGLLPFLLGALLAHPGSFSLWGGFTGFLWGGATRLCLASHALWLGGSYGHRWGHRSFETADDSRNSFLLSLLLLGDGWHNNHHAAPRAANLDAHPWQIDLLGLCLRVLSFFGLIRSMRWLDRADWQARREALNPPASPAPLPPFMAMRSPKVRKALRFFIALQTLGGAVALGYIALGKAGKLEFAVFVVFHLLAYLGIVLGYHRMLCHRAFVPHPAVKAILLYLGALPFLATPSEFVAQHLAHHAHADGPRDPHSTHHGFFHAHVGWILSDREVTVRKPAWLRRDPMVAWFDRKHGLIGLSGLLLPGLLCGLLGALGEGGGLFSFSHALGGTLLGGSLRIFLGQHLIFASASLNHSFGPREFDTADRSHNSPWLLNVLQLGEGYHNHHHALPWAASFALHPWQCDVSAWIIHALERLGLARKVQWASAEDWESARKGGRGRARQGERGGRRVTAPLRRHAGDEGEIQEAIAGEL